MLDVHTLSFLFSLLSAFNRLNKCDVCLSSTQRLQTSTKMPHLIRYWHWTACVLGAVPLPPDGVLLLDSGVDKKGMRQGHWLGLVLCVPVSGLTLMIGQQEVQKPCFTNPRVFQNVEEEDLRGNQLTQVHLEQWLLNGSSSNSNSSGGSGSASCIYS